MSLPWRRWIGWTFGSGRGPAGDTGVALERATKPQRARQTSSCMATGAVWRGQVPLRDGLDRGQLGRHSRRDNSPVANEWLGQFAGVGWLGPVEAVEREGDCAGEK